MVEPEKRGGSDHRLGREQPSKGSICKEEMVMAAFREDSTVVAVISM